MTDAEINAQIVKAIDNASAIWANQMNAMMAVIEAQAKRLNALENQPHFERPNDGL